MYRLLASLTALFILTLVVRAQVPVPTSPPGQLSGFDAAYIRNPRLGIAHISAAEGGTSADRYRQALRLGAGWNRTPIYWDRVELSPGAFDWSAYDRQVADDLLYRLNINAILLGRPSFYAEGDQSERFMGLNLPIFADGTDTPEPGKALNPANPWAVFVYEAVNRYRPGGTLSQRGTLPVGVGITTWEMWNEPDVPMFWSASIGEYARLLKVGYLAAKQADPSARVIFAGLLFSTQDNWLARVLALYQEDVAAEANQWYMDAVAIHAYADPWRTGWLVLNVRQTFAAYGIDKEIWVTENGAPVWDDYPGPTWTADTPDQRQRRVTQTQQAYYVIQSAVYGWSEGADVLILHQLYDDCGDQPAGTNFPPHGGELCGGESLCSGDAHGLFRNLNSSVCFSQHPQPGTPRPAADAYQVLAQMFNGSFSAVGELELTSEQVSTQQPTHVYAAVFEMGDGRRITVLWNKRLEPVMVALPAIGTGAYGFMLESSHALTPDENGQYRLSLPPATPDGFADLQPGAQAAVGGSPVFLIERPGGAAEAVVLRRDFASLTSIISSAPVSTPTPQIVIESPPRPTVDPAQDSTPPRARMTPLPVTSLADFEVSWRGSDDSGIDVYLVWVRVDRGDWTAWLETSQTRATYAGMTGSLYEFDVWARDLAGNWTPETSLNAEAVTQVE